MRSSFNLYFYLCEAIFLPSESIYSWRLCIWESRRIAPSTRTVTSTKITTPLYSLLTHYTLLRSNTILLLRNLPVFLRRGKSSSPATMLLFVLLKPVERAFIMALSVSLHRGPGRILDMMRWGGSPLALSKTTPMANLECFSRYRYKN